MTTFREATSLLPLPGRRKALQNHEKDRALPPPRLLAGVRLRFNGLPCAGQYQEGLETAIIFVDVVHGNDTTGPGTSTNPYKTIGKGVSVAVANNAAGIGTQVNIQPGTYRESITMSNSPSATSLPMTFQAVTNGTVFIDGATVMTGWTVFSGNTKIFTNNWTIQFPYLRAGAGMSRRAEHRLATADDGRERQGDDAGIERRAIDGRQLLRGSDRGHRLPVSAQRHEHQYCDHRNRNFACAVDIGGRFERRAARPDF